MVSGILISALLAAICVSIHFLALRHISRRLALRGQRLIGRMAVLFSGVLIAHFAEIWIYAMAFKGLVVQGGFGSLLGEFNNRLSDYLYFSVTSYTSLGVGDIWPSGALRLISGFETLTGLLMITWSASFTFLAMQRYWRL